MKKYSCILFLLFGLLLASLNLNAQEPVERSSEIVKIGGKEYYMHHVKSGETLWGLSQTYQVTVEEIERLNPEVKNGLKSGVVIGIPKVTETQTAAEPETSAVTVEPVKPETPKVEPRPSQQPSALVTGGNYVVQTGEDLYDIAKKFGIDIADFKAINPGLTNEPAAGMTIRVPDIVNENDYIVHKVEFNERVNSLLRRWKVSEGEFREKNISVGSHVFVNQVVLIPIEPVAVTPAQQGTIVADEEEPQPIVVEDGYDLIDEEPASIPECNILSENAMQRYKVALLVPLYLGNNGSVEVTKENAAKTQKSRAMVFLQFYEGFMMAVEQMTAQEGLKLDLKVIDVTEDVYMAENAVRQMESFHPDLIVGPFFGKSFDIVEAYAKEKNILVVNPMSTRESVIQGNPNVVKVKPGMSGQIMDLTHLVQHRYKDANVFIVSKERFADTLFLNVLEEHLNHAINGQVAVSGQEMLDYARSESQKKEMGERMVQTVTVEGQVYATNDLKENRQDIVFENTVKRYSYSNISTLKSQLSGVRDNLIIAYGDDNVFATQVLNTMKKEADDKPVTLVAVPDWTKFEKLLVSNLLAMNAIYFTDCFVDYSDDEVKDFVLQFRSNYRVEPQDYAFEGYDLARYFLGALMRYGGDMKDCLPYYNIPLFHTRYHFMERGEGNGLENQSWSIYQYDNEAIELHPIDPRQAPSE